MGIESTAHTLGIALTTIEGELLSERKNIYFPETGLIPLEVTRKHREIYSEWRSSLLLELSEFKIAAIGYSSYIGFESGLELAKEIATDIQKETGGVLLPCPHNLAHLEMSKSSFKEPIERGLYVYVSGSNTQISFFEGDTVTPLIETQDIALGNLLDKFARVEGIGAPGGPLIENLARNHSGPLESFPYPLRQGRIDFSGLIEWLSLRDWDLSKKAYHLQEYTFRSVCEAVERSYYLLRNQGVLVDHLLFSGGVCCNNSLSHKLQEIGNLLGLNCKDLVEPRYHGDNGLMIALLARKKLSRNSMF